MGLGGQFERVQKAARSRWGTVTRASEARPIKPGESPSNNYFSRRDVLLDPEMALWLEQETGFRAAWLMFGEEPEMAAAFQGGDLQGAYQSGRAQAILEVIVLLKGLGGATTPPVASTSPSGLTPDQVRQTVTDVDSEKSGHGKAKRRQRKAQ